jgi:4-hydroxyphenylacetate 3-monooxygenase/anthranilate 3-monooxygenase (FAD)/4-hydroxyphenylacetate 3-monooxygenase
MAVVARTGRQYLDGLKDGRRVWLGAEEVDVLACPAFAGSCRGMAGYFDWQHRYAEDCLVQDGPGGDLMSASLLIPRSPDDLAARHRCFDRLAKYAWGMLGRTPDYVDVTLAGFVARSDMFCSGSDEPARRLEAFHREVIAGDLVLTHALIQPAIDRSIGDLEGQNGELALKAVGRTAEGVIVRGAKVLATLAPFSNEMFVYPQLPLPKGADPAHALCFSVPMASPGLITVCRDHYGAPGDVRDHPFSARFDEQDGFIIFDDVLVPYERLFIDGDVETYNRIRGSGWAPNVFQQTAIRAANKLEFAHELGTAMAKMMNAAARADYAAMLGEIWAYAQLARAAIAAAEAGARDWGNGAFLCDDRPLRALRDVMPTWMERVNRIFQAIGSHNLLATPSLEAFENEAMAPLLERYLPGAAGASARERAQVFRAAWDFAGSALGGRVELYEKFYLAGQPRNFTRDHIQAMAEPGFGERVEGFLAELACAS